MQRKEMQYSNTNHIKAGVVKYKTKQTSEGKYIIKCKEDFKIKNKVSSGEV